MAASALFRDGDAWAVFVNQAQRARLRRVRLGLINDAYAEVRDGLATGDEVVLFPSEDVAAGARLMRRGR